MAGSGDEERDALAWMVADECARARVEGEHPVQVAASDVEAAAALLLVLAQDEDGTPLGAVARAVAQRLAAVRHS